MRYTLKQRLIIAIVAAFLMSIVLAILNAIISQASPITFSDLLGGFIIGYVVKYISRRPDHYVGLVAALATVLFSIFTYFFMFIINGYPIAIFFSIDMWLYIIGLIFSFTGPMSIINFLFFIFAPFIAYQTVCNRYRMF